MRPLFVSVLALALAACSKQDAPPADTPTVPAGPRVPLQLRAGDFDKVRWLEGRWRGTEAGGEPFFEGYTLLDDSTMKTLTYPDSTFAQAGDSGTISLRGGLMTSGDAEPKYVATALDSSSVRFDPLGTATNAFTWKRVGPDSWTATLEWRGNKGETRQRTYEMQRVRNR